MAESNRARVFYGAVVHSVSLTELEILENAVLAVTSDGCILGLERNVSKDDLETSLKTLGVSDCPVTELSHGQFLIPGFVDTHNHAPQWMQRGLGQGMHILDWLSGITFPNESRFGDAAYAKKVYPLLVQGMLRQGVTTASYYSSLHGEGTRILADVCLEKGQRALIGKCNMNRNSPDYYQDASVEESLEVTHRCINHIRSIDPKGEFVRPVLTPRFAISCEQDLLQGLGDIASKDPSLAIQTHFNEAQQEIDATLSLFPAFKNEADLYEHFGLLKPTSILAHCTIMTPYETERLQKLDCGVAHCPTANMTVGGGFMASPIKEFLRRGIKVGLGTDSGGGYSSSMLNAMQHALVASFARDALYDKDQKQEGETATLSPEEVFYMATMGGARVVGFADEIGDFSVGKHFDAVVVDMRAERRGVNAPVEERDSTRTMFDKFMMTGDDRNIVDVYVKGRIVHSNQWLVDGNT